VKKINHFIRFLLFSLLLSCTSCGLKNNGTYIIISSGSAREAVEKKVENLTNITLAGVLSSSSKEEIDYDKMQTIDEWASWDELEGKTIEIEAGYWDFLLTASLGSSSYSATSSINVLPNKVNPLSFTLKRFYDDILKPISIEILDTSDLGLTYELSSDSDSIYIFTLENLPENESLYWSIQSFTQENTGSTGNTFELDVSQLAAGSYVITVVTSSGLSANATITIKNEDSAYQLDEEYADYDYVFDLYDGVSDYAREENHTIILDDRNNTYESFGKNLFFSHLTTYKKLKKGDKLLIKAKITSDTDLEQLYAYIIDNSSEADNWKDLILDYENEENNLELASNIKADIPFEITKEVIIQEDQLVDLSILICADSETAETSPTLTFERLCNSSNSIIYRPEPQEFNINLNDYLPYFEISKNYKWVDGKQDYSQAINYQCVSNSILDCFKDSLPIAGDIINFTWSGSADKDIPNLYLRLIDNSRAANWWTELEAPEIADKEGGLFASDIQKDKVFTASISCQIVTDAISSLAICLCYPIEENESEDNSSTFKIEGYTEPQ